ncbi:MAG: DNA polymerase III subunit delta [Bacteroidota bacterium]
MTFEAIIKDIQNKKFAPIYFLCGEESYYIDQVVEAIEAHALSESEKSFNQTILYGADTDVRRLMDECMRLPLMAPRQVVIVKEAQQLKKMDDLENYILKPSPTTLLVLASKAKFPDKRKSFSKSIIKNGVVLETKRMYDNQAPVWIENHINALGYKVSKEAIQLLADYLGTEISIITNEVSKLVINKNKGEAISLEDIEKNVGISKDFNSFELNKAISLKDIQTTFRIANYFEANPKNNPIVVTLSNLQSFFTTIFQMHHMSQISDAALMSEFRLWPAILPQYKAALRHYPLRKTENILIEIANYDLRSKGIGNVNIEHGQLLKELMAKILYV